MRLSSSATLRRVLVVRPETEGDVDQIELVLEAAFAPGNGEPIEVSLVKDLRRSDSWIPSLALVALSENRVVGYCVTTRGHIGSIPVLALGPIGVVPGHQTRGVGSALIHRTVSEATAHREKMIGLLGDPGYYSRFGFVPWTETRVVSPVAEWGNAFQVLELDSTNSLSGVFRYPEEFGV